MNPPGSSSSTAPSSRKRGQVYNAASVGLDFLGNISEGSDILSPLKAACRATNSVLNVIQAINDTQEEWDEITRRLDQYMSSMENQIDSFEKYPPEDRKVDEAFSRPLVHYVETLEDFSRLVENHRHKRSRSGFGTLTEIRKVKIDAGVIRNFNRDIEDLHRQFMEALSSFTAFRIQAIERKMERILTDDDASAILQLPIVAFVASSVHNTCLQGTREAVLQTIWRWAEDDMSDKPIFWLCDIAGSGKSTVTMSVAESWRAQGILGGQFFFSMASSEASTTEKFCSTIARELANYIPELAPHVAAAIKQNPAILRRPLHEQFRALIIEPLRHRQERIVLVLDAIDECKLGSQRRELLDTLSRVVGEASNLKIFMTSRPDPVIEDILKPLSIKAELKDRLHDVSHHDNIDDISTYVHQSLREVLSHDKRQRLVEKAKGLFIWASTACRMLIDPATFDTPESIYHRLIAVDQNGAMDEVYDLVFERTDPNSYSTMCSMLALLLAAFEPLTINDFDDLLKSAGICGRARALVKNLGSVLTEDPTTNLIQFRHPTFIEYLRGRCTTPTVDNRSKMYLDITHAHGQAASWCLRSLKSPKEGLKFNICDIKSSFYLNRQLPDLEARVSKLIPRKLQYGSLHWLFHVSETDGGWRRRLKNELRYIVTTPYPLYWMEILSAIGGVARAIGGLRSVAWCTEIEEGTKGRIHEIQRFMMTFLVAIQDSIPHIYLSALPFTPRKSNLHVEGLHEYKDTIGVTQGLEDIYYGLPDALRGHDGWVNAAGFSPDGSQIVSGSDDTTIRLWDAATGQPLGEPLRGHEDSVLAVGFSPDGSQIVSGSWDTTIRLWDAATGQPLGEPLRGHEHSVRAVGFSPDGSQIVSGSHDRTIRLWDAATGQPLGEPLRGHEDSVRAVGFSPDGSQIVSGSSDTTIRLWDAATGQPLGEPLRGHEHEVRAVGLSPDGSQIVSGSSDRTIRLWDAATGQPLGEPLRGHEDSVWAVGFSPDGLQIVSGSEDETVRLWDAATGQLLEESRRGHKHSANAFGSSAGDRQILTDSDNNGAQLWDLWHAVDHLGNQGSEPVDLHFDNSNGRTTSPGTPLPITVPGFKYCSLLQDGWVQSSGKFLFWVPPDNRHGLRYPRSRLTIPTNSSLRTTRIDFTNFCCGTSWTRVRGAD